MTPRTLIAYYSMTGNTQKIADEIRAAMGADADLEQIHEPHERHGMSGAFRAMFDALTRRKPPIEPIDRQPANYDLLILGGPVWAGRMASPVRTYASRHGGNTPQVAFFCTEGGRGADKAFAELERLCHRAPSATLVVDHEHLAGASHHDEVARFTATARRTVQ